MTQYCIIFKFTITCREVVKRYETAQQRALAIIGYTQWADVVRTWEE